MKITLSPARALPGETETAITVDGDTITVDGVPYDLSPVPEGGEAIPDEDGVHPFVGSITRQSGKIVCTIRAKLDDTATPRQPTDPAHWVVLVDDGPVTIPAIRKEETSE